MTPEELNRTIEFIIASQSRLAAAQEQDRQDKFYENWLRQNGDSRKQSRDSQKQALHLLNQALHFLNLILDRLPPASPTAG